MSYKSPIDVVLGAIQTEFENGTYKAVQHYGVHVDKKELLKALKYDRGQYEKGFLDGYHKATESIVRCCYCKHCKVNRDVLGNAHWHCRKAYGFPDVDPTDFCSHGERKEQG